VTTPPLLPSLPSDKLVAPLNAPRAGVVATGVQPGVSGTIVLAQYVVVFGTSGGVFIYDGTPSAGNAPLYWVGNVTEDPYGNQLDQGIWAGQPGSIQVGIQTSGAGPGGTATVFFVPVGNYQSNASIGIAQAGGQAILEILGAQTTAAPAANSDRVAMFLWDHGSAVGPSASAALQGWFYDTAGNAHNFYSGNFAGLSLPAASMFAVDPATGTSQAVPFASETWHNITLDSGWTAVVQPQYRMLGDSGNVQVRGQITHAGATTLTTINNTNPIPAAYWPASTRLYRPPIAGDSAGTIEITSAGIFAMRASGFTATAAYLDGIYAR
jgi:hypothetical protein